MTRLRLLLVLAVVAVAAFLVARSEGPVLLTRSNACTYAMPGAKVYRDPASPGCLCPSPDHPVWIPPQTAAGDPVRVTARRHRPVDYRHSDQWSCGESISIGG